jgi:hypothetical protein
MKPTFIALALMALCFSLTTSAPLPKQWLGQWNGTMFLYKHGQVYDSVAVSLQIETILKDSLYTWKTDYHSAKMPMTKDYKLRLKDAKKNIYITDEGGGVELTNYLIDNKMYSIFEVQNTILTASYELRDKELIFEVTSGKKEPDAAQGINNYSVNFLQKVRLKKIE